MPDTKPNDFLTGSTPRSVLLLNGLMAAVYFGLLTFFFDHGNPWLFGFLIAGEVFHLIQILGYGLTVFNNRNDAAFEPDFKAPVDIYITVCGEPIDIIEETARAAIAIDYPKHLKKIFLLNDGKAAGKDNWKEVELLAKRLNIGYFTREESTGAKAGNINNAVRQTEGKYIVVFDADHVPHEDFLTQTIGYFVDEKMGFVQTPQYYKNQHENNIAQTAWRQQTLFFGPIMRGKNKSNSAFMCGTNMVISREALIEAGGMCEFNIAEDFLTSLFIHANGWKSVYVPKILAEGLAPEDFLSYYKQQYRWTRGSLEVIFKQNPFFKRGLTFSQKVQYLVSASYYLSGFVVFIDALLPLIFLFTGITAINTATMALAMIFIPYMFLNLYVLQRSSNASYTFEAISFSLSSFFLQMRACFAVLTGQKTSFTVTSKSQISGNFLYLATPHLIYIAVAVLATIVGLSREGLSASLLANLAWVLVNVTVFVPFILASLPNRSSQKADDNEKVKKRHRPMIIGQSIIEPVGVSHAKSE